MAGDKSSISSSVSTSSLYRRLAQTDADTELIPNPVTESDIRAAVVDTQNSVEELQEKAKVCSQGISLLFELFN